MKVARGRYGFTLVEIMIVVSIIGMLALLAIPKMLRAREKSIATTIARNLTTFGDGFDLYNLEQGGYPPDTHITVGRTQWCVCLPAIEVGWP